MHVHVSVANIENAVGFYSALFAAKPTVVKDDYAKWMLDDPRMNFAISTRGREPGLDHLGIQVESQTELHEVYARLKTAGGTVIEQGKTAYGSGENEARVTHAKACCAPAKAVTETSCACPTA